MQVERVNPEVLLKAAEVARPGINWVISDGIVMDDDSPPFYADYFNPLTSDADAMKLERALKDGFWNFGRHWMQADKRYWAVNTDMDIKVFDESDTLLLLKCVAATTGLPLEKT